MSQALAALQGWLQPAPLAVQPAPLALALLLGAAKLCSAWAPATLAEVHPHPVPAMAPPALGSPHLPLKNRHDLDRTARVLPLVWGLWLQSWSPGLSSVLGAAVRGTSPIGRVGGAGRLCHTSAGLSILSLSG